MRVAIAVETQPGELEPALLQRRGQLCLKRPRRRWLDLVLDRDVQARGC
ncbi:hypothetical protein [Novosphingobium sp.]